jgi:long-chain-fatty-acid--[acyl-carrier-protein] ligase
MLWSIRWLIWALLRVLLSLRYRVTVCGKEEVFKHPGPYLILPNHPAQIDPPNLLVRFWPAFKMRPMFWETALNNPVLTLFTKLLRGIPVPDTDSQSAEARLRAKQAIAAVVASLKAGENVILWPSGMLQRDGVERLGGARTTAEVLAVVPNVTFVLVRTRGLWGSMFSWAWAEQPSLGKLLIRGIGILLANLIVFTPRRHVNLTIEAFAPDRLPEPTREKLNRWLEEWYNADTGGIPEKPTFVPYHFLLGPRTAEFPPPPPPATLDLPKVKPVTKQAVAQIVEEKIGRPLVGNENTLGTKFMQLGMDSLDAMELALRVEQRFGFRSERVPTTIGDLWELAEGLLEPAPLKPPPTGWFASLVGPRKAEIVGETIPVAILNVAFRFRKQLIVCDDLAGGLSYEKLIIGAWVMSRSFAEITAPNVGLLLPASVAADIAFLGLHLAGKTPVILNWTTGPANLAHAATTLHLTHVVTSRAFIGRTQVKVPCTTFVFLEDVRANISNLGTLRRLLMVRLLPDWTRSRLIKQTSLDPTTPAVVLFTSGSEKAPKAVPLTHTNIFSDQKACLTDLSFTRADSAIGFLPMFHSFGLTVTTLIPLVTGIRVVHHPDPTDAGAIIRKVATYKPTVLVGTPTFLGFVLDLAKPGELDSLRLIIVGAEKMPQEVFDKAKQLIPHAAVIEGYGLTECSPVISVTLPGQDLRGTVGRPLTGVKVCVTDLETGRVLPSGKEGMLNVAGPTVFPGYIAYDGPSPFREIDGKRWYITGDLGVMDGTGVITFHGRLKRFLKAGGEMISLPALEEPFARLYPPTVYGPRVAVEGIETPGCRRIVLFTTENIGLQVANALLEKEGFHGVLRLDEVLKLDSLPVLGTGKADYKILRAMLTG